MKRTTYICVVVSILVAAVAFVASSTVLAEVPPYISYQGRLTDTDGSPVDGIHLIKFKIYASSDGDDSLWSSGYRGIPVENGLFSYQLGDSAEIPVHLLNATDELYLGITVGADPEMPRTKLVSVPFAFKAQSSDSASTALSIVENSITSAQIVDGGIELLDLGQNGASQGQVIMWDGSAWVAGLDEDENPPGWIDTGSIVELVDSNDSVGIGTSAPSEKVQIASGRLHMGNNYYAKNALHSGDIIFDNGKVDVPGVKFYYAANKNFGIDLFDDDGGGLRFVENLDESGQTRMIIREGGNVGINVLVPTERLDVAGNIRSSGTVTVGTEPESYSLPLTDGDSGQVMTTDGNGQLSWTALPGVAYTEFDSVFVYCSDSFSVITSVTITVPSDGFINLLATCNSFGLSNPLFALDTIADGRYPVDRNNIWTKGTLCVQSCSDGVASMSHTLPVGTGTHTYYLLFCTGTGTHQFKDGRLTAMFFPISYGS